MKTTASAAHGRDSRQAAWHHAYRRTRDLFRLHFGIDMPGTASGGGESHPGAECCDGGSGCILVLGDPPGPKAGAAPVLDRDRPRPLRGRPPAAPGRRTEPDLAGSSARPA